MIGRRGTLKSGVYEISGWVEISIYKKEIDEHATS